MFYPIAYYQNQFLPISKVHIHPTDLGVQRGYSIFDFFKLINFENPWLDWYMERLTNSAKTVGLTLQLSEDHIKQISADLLRRNDVVDGNIKIIVSAGNSTDGYRPSSESSILIMAMPLQAPSISYYNLGAHLILANYKRDMPNVKTTNYLKSAMLANRLSAEEAIDVLYHDGEKISETSRCNFFLVQNHQIITPKKGILQGITRRRVLNLEGLRFPIIESDLFVSDLKHANEAFITSTTKGVMPVISIDELNIGDGKVGPMTKELMAKINTF